MKSSFELAMERLNKSAPAAKLTTAQKEQIAELESRYKAKIAEREIALKAELAKVVGNADAEAGIREQSAMERKKLLAELDEKKERIRQGKN
ncbi:MAG TPA: hypothetical protein VFV23_14430 [Verrucomicrobiae bacterium]|nr:hypothetical protein [Verrucomicrobiae bacterium]